MEEALFSWLHISDIHMGHGDASQGWDQKLVLDALRHDVETELRKGHARPEVILVTGDIAFSGNGRRRTEYDDARSWLEELCRVTDVPPERVFLVPGNHDLSRAMNDDPSTKRLLKGVREGQVEIDEVLATEARGILTRRMEAYLAFAQGFAKPELLGPDALFWTHRLEARGGLRVRLVGLNTALVSADDQDYGRLRLGKAQIHLGLGEQPKEGELVIAMSHHPLRSGWLADEKEVDGWLKSRAHVHLSGHVHEAESEWAGTGGGTVLVRVVAGSAHGDRAPDGVPAGHGYSFGAVLRGAEGKARLRVMPRKWSDPNKDFRVDVNNVSKDRPFAEHELPLALPSAKKPLPKPPGSAIEKKPVSVYIAYAPEDEAISADLKKHLKLMQRRGLIERVESHVAELNQKAEAATSEAIQKATIILLLLSNDYLISDYSYEVEMPIAKERYESGQAIVVPILARPFEIDKLRTRDESDREWFEKLVRLPRNEKPITKWADRDEALTEIAKELRAVIEPLVKRG